MPNNINIIVLCAGKSSRMGLNIPKVALTINGVSLIENTLKNLQKLNPEKIILVVGFKKNLVIEEVKKLKYKNIEFIEQKKLLGTGDAVKPAISKLNKKSQVIVLNGDTPFIEYKTLRNAIKKFIDNKGDFLLTTSKPLSPSGYGRIIRNSKGNIVQIIEERNCSTEEKKINEVNSGLYIFKKELLQSYIKKVRKNIKGEYYLTDLVEIFSNNKKNIISISSKNDSEFFNINSFDDLIKAHHIDNSIFFENCIRNNIKISDPSTVNISKSVKLGRNITIGPNVYIQGDSTIGEDVNILGNCYIENSSVGKNTLIKPFVNILDSKIGNNCEIGPFSNIRPDTHLYDNIKIGNFVEIKKSKINNNSKIPHLSYIGDTEMGSGVNIGAGSITCNYDGFNKHKTLIGDNVFIGSDTMMIAPIKIGKGATTGAGTILSGDLDDNSLGITRIKEKNIPNWKRKPKLNK